jgi:hypothetical protein
VKWITRIGNVAAFTNFNAPSEPNGIVVNYYQKAPSAGEVTLQVIRGTRVVAEGKGTNVAGINQVLWNMQETAVVLDPKAETTPRPTGRPGQAAVPTIPTFGGTVPAQPGDYTIVVKAGGKTLMKKTRIIEDAWFDKAF